jgi:hypothetical protein
MSPRVQRWLRLLTASGLGALVGLATHSLNAQTNQPPPDADIPKDLLDVPDLSLSLWNQSILLRSGFGYKDNVLFSSQQPAASPYAQNGLDYSILRLLNDGSSFFFMVTGDDTRYLTRVESQSFATLTPTTIANEDEAIAAAQFRWNLSDHWQPTFSLQYLYQNQVFNIATEPAAEAGLPVTNAAVDALGNNITFRPYLHGQFTSNWWADFEWDLTRQWFNGPLYTYWLTGPRLTLGHSLRRGDTVSLSYETDRILYDNETQATLGGAPIPGTLLRVWQQQAELRYTHYFDAAQHWSAVSRAGFIYDAGDSSGYFDFYNFRFAEEAVYQAGTWKCQAQARYWRFSFPGQSAGNGKLECDILTLMARVEKKVSKHWRVFAQYQHDNSLSNDASDRYEAGNVEGGVELEF